MVSHLHIDFRRRATALKLRDEIRRQLQLTRFRNGAITGHHALLKKTK